MNMKERLSVSILLGIIVIMVSIDLITDSLEGVKWWHLCVEGGIAVVSLLGIFLLLRGSIKLNRHLKEEKIFSAKLRSEADMWKLKSQKYIEGLSMTIDMQLTNWSLTKSEKEIAFLLLKGLSLKEIAEIRNTSERTVRTQSIGIYSKAGIKSRSELAAFFLEDLLPPI